MKDNFTFRTEEEIYSAGIITEGDDHFCSVCKKHYHNIGSAIKHFNKKSCHSAKNIFEGTITEDI